MSNINKVVLTGNLTRDIELRATQTGTTVGTFGIASNEGFKNSATGEWEERPNFINCTIFGDRATKLSPYLAKGIKVAIVGHLRYSSWEADDGTKRSKLDVIVDEVEFLSKKKETAGEPVNTESVPPDYNAYATEDIPF